MHTKRIIPCLDVHNGRVVKGVNFVNLRDAGDPVEIAAYYNKSLADELVFLDITASSDARNIMLDVVAKTAEQVFIPLTVGGGIKFIPRTGVTLPFISYGGSSVMSSMIMFFVIQGIFIRLQEEGAKRSGNG